ncbi:MAG TPA: hypothetical protein DCP08_06075 [Chloroflexi bacterium]|nr:hypothetical protein [Chloroflexota bacterium]
MSENGPLMSIVVAVVLSGLLSGVAYMVFVDIFAKRLGFTQQGSWVRHDYLVDQKARRRIRWSTLIFFLVTVVLCLGFQIVIGAPTNAPVPTPTIEPSPEATSTPERTPPPTAVITYTVQSGDTLAKIAAKFGVTVEEIVEANDIQDPSLINVGQVLVIPTSRK